MKTTIHELLQHSPDKYQQDYFERYLRWCMSYATNLETDLQKLLANGLIANYYNENFKPLEHKFVIAATPIHKGVKVEVIRKMYAIITAEIFINYPSALFDEARNLKIINYN